MNFAEVILPIPIDGTFTYRIPVFIQSKITVGSRVIVPLGKKKIHTGVVASLQDSLNSPYEPKEILELLDSESPSFTTDQIKLFDWISKYYMCTLGEVVHAALPSGLKLTSESYITIDPETDSFDLELTDREKMIMHHISQGDMKMHDLSKALGIKTTHQHIKNLKEKKAIQVFEKIKDKYTPKTERRIRLAHPFLQEEELDALSATLEKKPKQLDVLVTYLREVDILENPKENKKGISRKNLLEEGVSPSSLQTLTKNEIFEEWNETIPRIPAIEKDGRSIPQLSSIQEKAKSEIIESFQKHDTTLLKGVTGSGKTEIYISLINDIISDGGMVLYLLPEIALTTQIIKRLALVFGNNFGVYHSRYSDNERVEVWQNVLQNKYKFVVGVRSAVFLPFSSLSLVIVDEEHESSYKQYEPAPRYHARDTAIYLATRFGAKTLLGTATPSIESYYNTEIKKYGLVNLDQRYGDVSLPAIGMVDMVKSRKKKQLKGNFSNELLEKIEIQIQNKKQVIIFQNRRGYAPFLSCENCGYIPKCPHCDVSLTYHSFNNILVCHYCGHRSENLTECPQCQSVEIRTISYGTEKLEEELGILIPEARIGRMDLDSTRSKHSYEKIIDDFEIGNLDILIGTQMVTKGLDFGNVSLVGILDTDRMIHFPDFRSHERAFQLLYQVSGRSGRRKDQGEVIIQTTNPDQQILHWVRTHDFLKFYFNELNERKKYGYPPFKRIIKVVVKDKDKKICQEAAVFYTREISRHLGSSRIIGPVEPVIGRIRNQYLFEITVKLEKKGIKLKSIKDLLLNSRNLLRNQRLFKSVRIVFDVDPL